MSNVYQTTGERLLGYYPFNDSIIHAVSNVADMQAGMDFDTFMAQTNIPEPRLAAVAGHEILELVDIRPAGEHDPTNARVMHLGIGNRLDDSQLYQIATDFAVDPSVRTVAFSNPGAPGYKAGALSLRHCVQVFQGNPRPLVDGRLRYMETNGITTSEQDGFSAGSLFVLAAAEYAERYDQEVTQITAIEPADVKDRGSIKPVSMGSLGLDFARTGGPLPGYVKASGINAYMGARHDSTLGMAKYLAGILRATNLAVASQLDGSHFAIRAARALDAQPQAKLDAIWGSKSELAADEAAANMASVLSQTYGGRFNATRIAGGKHNMVNDIHLQAALFLHARSPR